MGCLQVPDAARDRRANRRTDQRRAAAVSPVHTAETRHATEPIADDRPCPVNDRSSVRRRAWTARRSCRSPRAFIRTLPTRLSGETR